MILEMKTTRYVPGATGQVNLAYEQGLPERVKLSPFAGLFHLDTGVLNSTIELWSYEDREQRDVVQKSATEQKDWPPELERLVVGTETMLLEPAPSNHEFPARGDFGGLYEFRIYQIVPGKLDDVFSRWSEKISEREQLSPFLGAFGLADEKAPVFVHIWAYDDAGHRQATRAEAQRRGNWPPGLTADGLLVRQESILAIPAPFSPLH